LRDLFLDDACRYGPGTARGRLAEHWADAYEMSGGDLAAAWQKFFPADECLLIAAAQNAGGNALPDTLRDLARAVRLIERARSILLNTLGASLLALAVAVCMVGAVPLFTVPRLHQVFQVVPPAYYGRLTVGLFGLAEVLRYWLAFLLALLAGGAWLVLWSLPNFTGRLRVSLDRFFPWRLYRDFHAIRFLAMLAILMRQRDGTDTRLRQALAAHAWAAAPWLAWHVDAMVARIDSGLVGAETFDTGLLDRETWWFMSDMVSAHGMQAGVQSARQRIESKSLARTARQAQTLRWSLLLGAVACVLGLALWHYGVVDEMRRALTNFYASR
jgi:type II secretory pathway component PulF